MYRLPWIILAAALAVPSTGGATDADKPPGAGIVGENKPLPARLPAGPPPSTPAASCSGSVTAVDSKPQRDSTEGNAGTRPAPRLCGLKPPKGFASPSGAPSGRGTTWNP